MAQSTLWWVLAGTVIALELLSGTFYLLMISSGLIAAALSAHLGASMETQLVMAALVSCGAVAGWRVYQKKKPQALPASINHDVNMDIGEQVHVDAWNADGSSEVKYRGAQWQVELVAGTPPSPGLHRIVEVVGSHLKVKKI